MISIQEVTVWEEEKQTINPETDKDWGFMRRIHFWVKKYVLKASKKGRQLSFSMSSRNHQLSRRTIYSSVVGSMSVQGVDKDMLYQAPTLRGYTSQNSGIPIRRRRRWC